jgi:hypothetical protein
VLAKSPKVAMKAWSFAEESFDTPDKAFHCAGSDNSYTATTNK